MITRLSLIISYLCIACSAHGQELGTNTYETTAIMNEIKCSEIVGELNDFGAQKPAAFTNCATLPLRRHWLGSGQMPVERGMAYVGSNKHGLVFYVWLEDLNIYTRAQHDKEKLWTLGDTVEFFIKPGAEQDGYWEVHLSPNGFIMDIYIASREKMTSKTITWEEMIAYKSGSRHRVFCVPAERRWGALLEVPWSAFGRDSRPPAGTRWQFAVCRYNYAGNLENPELSSTAPLKKLSFHAYEYFNQLLF